jgi:hypothetical protein
MALVFKSKLMPRREGFLIFWHTSMRSQQYSAHRSAESEELIRRHRANSPASKD